jgi:hypothetical protein
MQANKEKSGGKRWAPERVLREARARTRALNAENARQVRDMLARLLAEASWSDEQFLKLIIGDYQQKSGAQWPD